MWNFWDFFKKQKQQSVHNDLIGKQVKVLEDIDPVNGKGKVMVGESWWLAVSENNGDFIRKGETVTIKKVKGYQLVVGR